MAGVILDSFDDLIAGIKQDLGYASKTVNDAMEASMLAVQKEAKERVPVEHGNMEAAIKISNTGLRKGWAVYVDMMAPDDTGKYMVGDYAEFLHESIYTLGPLSLLKQRSVNPKVGRKFLENPFQETLDNGLLSSLQALLTDAMSRRR